LVFYYSHLIPERSQSLKSIIIKIYKSFCFAFLSFSFYCRFLFLISNVRTIFSETLVSAKGPIMQAVRFVHNIFGLVGFIHCRSIFHGWKKRSSTWITSSWEVVIRDVLGCLINFTEYAGQSISCINGKSIWTSSFEV
jgi:hypothetical protein